MIFGLKIMVIPVNIFVILVQIKIIGIQSVMIEARILQICSFTLQFSFQVTNALICIL